ncbi:hypothetical protein F5879DRAFT_948646 [Lentinula edodes]|uniref:F-box domain-containing protein n=1 Tax=Lentinula edodes TaxID=5353 RepID=A0A1Q3EB76_LENED|nr:hypothetical protein F5879DRAFT_948646 [Lentinula edodes]GAW04486.1 hypothetical protein LENED_006281 [Lentinula edodes]
MFFISLPIEVILEVLKYLSTSDILSLRQTCTYLAELSKDRLIWHDLIQEQRTRLPLPPNARGNLEAWSTDALESLVISNELIDDLWLIPRETPPVKLQNRRGELLLGLEIFADRWILAVYMDGYMDLWDAESPNEDRRWCFVYTGNDKTTSFKVAHTEDKLLVVITRAHLPGTWVAVLYQILLSESPSKLQFIPLRTFSISSSRVARQIFIRERIIAFSQLGLIELAQWSEDAKDVIRSTVLASNIQSDELEEMFTTILSLRILNDHYIFVFKTRSIELYPTTHSASPSVPPPFLPSLRHVFPSYSFRDVQIAEVESETLTEEESSSSGYDGTRYTLKMLASDVIQGLFYFVANITIPSARHEQSQPPILDVHLAAVYAMANHIPLYSRAHQRQRNTLQTSRSSHAAVHDRAVQKRLSTPRSDSVNSVRSSSFVSTYALGPQGMRAVWIERRRGSTWKQIVSCRLNPSSSNGQEMISDLDLEMWNSDSSEEEGSISQDDNLDFITQALDGHIIYSVQSYDLREDITFCALGEVSGKIVLGNRSGDVFILDTGV